MVKIKCLYAVTSGVFINDFQSHTSIRGLSWGYLDLYALVCYQIGDTFIIIFIDLLLHSDLQTTVHYTLQVITPTSPHTQLLITSLN
jgi:hypothetical protein